MKSKSSIKRISNQEWRKWCSGAIDLPIACDPDWAEAVTSGYNGRFKAVPWIVNYIDADEILVAYKEVSHPLPRLFLSPFGLYCGIARQSGAPRYGETLTYFLQACSYCYRSISYYLPFYAEKAQPSITQVKSSSFSTHVLELDAPYEVMFTKRFKGATRTGIRRAEREGLHIIISRELKHIRQYYKIHSELAKEKGGYGDLHPEKLFTDLLSRSERTELVVACLGEQVISGGIFFNDGPSVFYWHGATDRRYAALQPNYGVLDTMIRQSIRKGKRFFNFGGSAGILSLEKFKESWGATRHLGEAGSLNNPAISHFKRLVRAFNMEAF